MVLKIIQMGTFEAARWIAAALVVSGFIWSVGGFIAVAVWNTYRAELVANAGLATREDIQDLRLALNEASTSFVELSRQIVILSQPDEITRYREKPKAIDGQCSAGQPCTISVFAERSQRALDCQIIGAMTELLILAQGREYVATPSRTREATNLQGSPRALEPTFTLPRGVPAGEATAIIRSYYIGCAWQIDGQPPAIQDSPAFTLEIRP